MEIHILDAIDESAKAAVFHGLQSHNDKYAERRQCDFTIFLRESLEITGVAMGESKYDWIILQYLWVDERHCGKGYGKLLLNKVEDLACKRGLMGVHLDTFEFQARGFYEKAGYEVFGEIKDHPRGFTRYFMKKLLSSQIDNHSAQQIDAPEPASNANPANN